MVVKKKTYDGQPGALNDDYYRLVLGDGTEIQLQAGDLIFVDGQAPVNPGSYAVALSTSGLQRIKALLPNNLLKNVNTQQAIFEIVALPSPDPGPEQRRIRRVITCRIPERILDNAGNA